MKKILTLLVLVSSLFALVACQSAFSNTKVRVVGLSYRSSADELASVPSNNSMRLLSNKLVADEVEEYIFPGDVLTFTVELEDPNFEFISLLSIKFNDQIIRANVDNSIVTTRDCGANICVDFPFEISVDKSEYTVQEVKFAKLNSDNGVNAIIDNSGINKVILDVYQDDLFPFVLSSVTLLNELIAEMKFYNLSELENMHSDFDSFYWVYAWHLIGRTLFIENYNNDINQLDTYSINFGSINLMGDEQYYQYINVQDSNNFNTVEFSEFNPLFSKSGAPIYTLVQDKKMIFIGILEDKYSNMSAYNIGNTIYISINDEDYQLLVFDKLTRIVPLEFVVPLSYVD